MVLLVPFNVSCENSRLSVVALAARYLYRFRNPLKNK